MEKVSMKKKLIYWFKHLRFKATYPLRSWIWRAFSDSDYIGQGPYKTVVDSRWYMIKTDWGSKNYRSMLRGIFKGYGIECEVTSSETRRIE